MKNKKRLQKVPLCDSAKDILRSKKNYLRFYNVRLVQIGGGIEWSECGLIYDADYFGKNIW